MTAKLGRQKLKQRRRLTEQEQQAERQRLEAALEEGLKETFPASDAVAATQPNGDPPDADS